MPCNDTNEKKIKIKEEKFQPLSSKYKKISEKEEAKRARAAKKRKEEEEKKKKVKTGGKNAAGETEEESKFNLNKQSNHIILIKKNYTVLGTPLPCNSQIIIGPIWDFLFVKSECLAFPYLPLPLV